MSNNNNNNNSQPGFLNAPNHQFFMQNNGVGMQPQPQVGVGNHKGQNFVPPFVPNMQPPPPFMNAHMPHVRGLGPQNSVVVPNVNCNPMFLPPVQGQVMQNLSQLQGQIIAQSILSMLQQQQQPNMNMNMSVPNAQFCAPYPVQNMNQQLPMQVPNPSQFAPYGSGTMFGFPNQVPHAMVPQSSMYCPNPQLGGVDPNGKNMVPPPVNTNGFVSPQQLQGNNASGPVNPNLAAHTSNSQPCALVNPHSQENPNSNVKANVPNSNWKGSPSKNFKNKPNRGGFQGGFQKSKFHDNKNGKRRNGFQKEQKGQGRNNQRAGQDGLKSKEHKLEPERSFSVTYTEKEIQQWREARKRNHPFSNNNKKMSTENLKYSKIDKEVLQRELKEVLAKQAELGVEVAEIPSCYLKNSENQGLKNEGRSKFTNKRKFQNKFDRKSGRKARFSKKQKFGDKDLSESPSLKKRKPTLLQKLLSADVKRDKSHLFQVFRFMVMNSFFKHCPDKPLRYPSVLVKENGFEGDAGEINLLTGKDVLKHENEKTVQKIANHNNDDDYSSEDEDSHDESNSIIDNNAPKEPFSLVKTHCDNGEGIDGFDEEEDEEEGEIIE